VRLRRVAAAVLDPPHVGDERVGKANVTVPHGHAEPQLDRVRDPTHPAVMDVLIAHGAVRVRTPEAHGAVLGEGRDQWVDVVRQVAQARDG